MDHFARSTETTETARQEAVVDLDGAPHLRAQRTTSPVPRLEDWWNQDDLATIDRLKRDKLVRFAAFMLRIRH